MCLILSTSGRLIQNYCRISRPVLQGGGSRSQGAISHAHPKIKGDLSSGWPADNFTCELTFADVGLRGFLNRSNFILQHDEATLQVVMCRVGDLADVSPVIRIQLRECRRVKGLIRAEQGAEWRTRI